jgi:hypothetical protein
MLIPIQAVHCAAAAITNTLDDISQDNFEKTYHCTILKSPDVVNYYLQFDTEKDATAFILRWI